MHTCFCIRPYHLVAFLVAIHTACSTHCSRAELTVVIISDVDGHGGDPSEGVTVLWNETELEVLQVLHDVVILDED